MTIIVQSKDCGNSPKNLFVHALGVSIESGDREAFARCVSDDLAWTYPGRPVITGKAAAAELLISVRSIDPLRVEVENAISHGKSGSVNGSVQLASGEHIRFCHVVGFTNVKGNCVARITSFYADDAS